MAFITTHIKIALALREKYDIHSMDKYLSGVVYPDSRYITGIDRVLTHDLKHLPVLDNYDDFARGWEVHIKSDQAIEALLIDRFPEYIKRKKGYEFYITTSALKIILDILDYSQFNVMEYLRYINYAFNPNGESLEILKKHNSDIRCCFRDIKLLTPRDYRRAQEIYNIPDEEIDIIIDRAEKYNNKRDVGRIEKVTGLVIESLLNN